MPAFVAMPETRPIAQPNQELNITNINRKRATLIDKIGLPLNSFLIVKATAILPLQSVLINPCSLTSINYNLWRDSL